MAAKARESATSPNKTRDGNWEVVYNVWDTIDEQEAIQAVYLLNPPLEFRGQPRKPGESLRWNNRGIAEVTIEYGPLGSSDGGDDEEPKGDNPTLGTLEIRAAGTTFHTSQCYSQTNYPDGKGDSIARANVVGLHRDGVNGVDIHVPSSQLSLTKRFLPAAITGDYINKLEELQGKMNKSPFTISWGFGKKKYSKTSAAGELLFLGFDMKTNFTRSGVGVIEMNYDFLESKNRELIYLGQDYDDKPLIVKTKKGHDYLWVWYSRKEITKPAVYIEVPVMAFVSKVYDEAEFSVLGFG